jgi:murein DD-endopeptidase MepM/ murein hydrolase activator NlpD
MSKKGISQIKGPSEIRLGETAYYEVSRIYDLDDREKVSQARWKLYALDFDQHDNWRELKPGAGAPPKIGHRIPLTVTKQSLVGSELMLEAFIYEAEKRIPPGLRIKVLPGLEKKITRVELFKVDDSPIKEDTVMKYGQTIKVKVYTHNMQDEMVKLSLYEDDAEGGGHSLKNKNNLVAQITKALNKKGFLWHEFKLNADFSKIANAMMDGTHDKLHEYYIVVETAEHRSVSKNVDVQNPDYIKVQTVSSGKPFDNEEIYDGGEIEEVVVKGKLKRQYGANPAGDTGDKVVTVFKPDEKKKDDKCLCKQYDLIWGDKVSCEFRKKVVEICADLWGEKRKIEMANNLMAVFKWESGGTFKTDAPNQANSGGTGLIQFMPSTAKALLGKEVTVETVKNYYGQKYNKKTKRKEDSYLKRVKEFADMTAIDQLDYVKKYFEPLRGKTVEFVDFYLQVLFPASSLKEEHIVFASSLDKLTTRISESEKLKNLRVTSYNQNKGLDINSDGIIWKSEIKTKVLVYITEGLTNKAIKFTCNEKSTHEKIVASETQWHHPINHPQLRGWYNDWAPERSIHSNNIPGRAKGKHDGLDLYAPAGTQVYACIDGEVNEIYYSESYGNCINIKGNYNGKTYWFFYAHLSSISINAKDKDGNPTKVKAGDSIGKSGKTGSSATALKPNQVHLHFEVRTTKERTGGRVDPFSHISELNTQVIKNPKRENQP